MILMEISLSGLLLFTLSVLAAFFSLGFGFVRLLKEPDNAIIRLLQGITVSLFIYLFSYSLLYVVQNEKTAFISIKFAAIGILLFFNFSLIYLFYFVKSKSIIKKIVLIIYSILTLFAIIYLFIGDVSAIAPVKTNWGWQENAGLKAGYPLLLFLLGIINYSSLAYISILNNRNNISYGNRERFKRYFWAIALGCISYSLYNVIIMTFVKNKLPQLGQFFIVISSGFFFYYIYRYRPRNTDMTNFISLLLSGTWQFCVRVDFEGEIKEIFHLSTDELGYRENDLLKMKFSILFDEYYLKDKNFELTHWLSEQNQNFQIRLKDKLNRSIPFILSVHPFFDYFQDLNGYIVIGRENREVDRLQKLTSQLNNSNAQLRDLSTRDSLTKIFNRYKLMEELETEIFKVNRYSAKLSIIMFDLDHFKTVNDTYGHDVGDYVLISVVNCVKAHLREGDVFARWGGEEFIVLCKSATKTQACDLAERLRDHIENMPLDKVGNVTASFGATQFYDSDNSETILKRVDENLYKAKSSGRNRIESD